MSTTIVAHTDHPYFAVNDTVQVTEVTGAGRASGYHLQATPAPHRREYNGRVAMNAGLGLITGIHGPTTYFVVLDPDLKEEALAATERDYQRRLSAIEEEPANPWL